MLHRSEGVTLSLLYRGQYARTEVISGLAYCKMIERFDPASMTMTMIISREKCLTWLALFCGFHTANQLLV